MYEGITIHEMVLILIAVLAAESDLLWRTIPNTLVLGGMLCGMAGSVVSGGLPGLGKSLCGMALPFLMLSVLFYFHMIGAGDIKLFMAAGSFAGPSGILQILVNSFLAGGVFSLVILIKRDNFIPRLHYLAGYIVQLRQQSLRFKERPASYLDGTGEDGRFCFALPIGLCILYYCFLCRRNVP